MTVSSVWAAEGASGADSPASDLVGVLAGAVVLVVPGYVLGRISGRAGREPDASDPMTTARLAAGSILVHTLMLPLTYWLADSILRHGTAGYAWQIFGWLVGVVFVVPCVLGFGAVWLAGRREGSRSGAVARVLGFATSNRFVYAWSGAFADLRHERQPPVVRVRLRDGREVRGSFAGRAHAAEQPASHDLYLDRLYGATPPLPGHGRSGGIWINGEDIVTVEFFFGDTETDAQRKGSPMTIENNAPEAAEEPEAPTPVPAPRRMPRFRTYTGPRGSEPPEDPADRTRRSQAPEPGEPAPGSPGKTQEKR